MSMMMWIFVGIIAICIGFVVSAIYGNQIYDAIKSIFGIYKNDINENEKNQQIAKIELEKEKRE